MKKYSLWLIPPPGNIYNELARLISILSEKYSSPEFKPHVTLIGGLSGTEEGIISRALELSILLRPYVIKLKSVGYMDEYYKSLFIKVEETGEVLKAYLTSLKVFGLLDDQNYMPHLSLMYGNFSSDTKEEIINRAGKEFNMSFEVRSIHLFSTHGKPEGWYRIKEFILYSS